jgi:hypothetical protein
MTQDGEMQCEDGTGKMLNPWNEEEEDYDMETNHQNNKSCNYQFS